MKTINCNLHSIFLLIGPSNCGKGFFTKEVLIPGLRKNHFTLPDGSTRELNVQYISSDAIRQELLGTNFCLGEQSSVHKHETKMLQASQQAFDMLFVKLKNVTSWPIAAEAIVIDTTGLSKEFRSQVATIAKDNHYNLHAIVFDYKKSDDYFAGSEDDGKISKFVIRKHIDILRKDTMRDLSREKYKTVTKITSRNFVEEYEIKIDEIETYNRHLLDPSLEHVIVGDLHACLPQLKEMIQAHGFTIDDNDLIQQPRIIEGKFNKIKKLLLAGDIIDKGSYGIEMIDFVHKNLSSLTLLRGNHENFVYKALKGVLKPETISGYYELKKEFFTSITEFEGKQDTLDKFYDIVENHMLDFYIHPEFIVTHAPCRNKYLGKIDNVSLREQRNVSYPKRKDSKDEEEYIKTLEKFFDFIPQEASRNQPRHITNHIALRDSVVLKNKVMIDTGCIYGNKLTSVTVNNGGKLFFKTIRSDKDPKITNHQDELIHLFKVGQRDIDLSQLEPEEVARVEWAVKNKVNFISGTMSPADKNLEDNDLESLKEGLSYYKQAGVKKVVLQPKSMGSRANIYLHKDITKCYTTSRAGYLIRHVDLTKAYEKLLPRFQQYMIDNNVEYLVLDAELMPWSALGKGLIDNDYKVVEQGIQSEIEFLKQNGFDRAISDLSIETLTNYKPVANTATKEELKKKFGDTKYNTYKNTVEFLRNYYPVGKHEEAFREFSRQIGLFGQGGEPEFKPFSVLKVVYTDGTEKLFFDGNNQEIFDWVSDVKCKVIDLETEDALQQAQAYFDEITIIQDMEGVVIKPEKVYTSHIAPYLKSRNSRYLALAYGYDYQFPTKYKKLIESKKTHRKLWTSINEFAIGKKMLEVKYSDITLENKAYLNTIAEMVLEEKTEQGLDPRL